MADDETAWAASDGPGGMLRVEEHAMLDGFNRLAADARALVVVCGEKDAPAVARASALARSQAEVKVAVLPVPLGPLGREAVAGIGRTLVAVNAQVPPAELIARLPRAAESLLDLAVVSRVSGLDLPGVALGHHLWSYLPGRRVFTVQVTPGPVVARVTRSGRLRPGSPLIRPSFEATYGVTVTVAGPRPLPEVVRHLWTTPSAPSRMPPTAALTAFWGDPEATEVVAVPADVVGWIQDMAPFGRIVPCSWCGEPLAETTDKCVFCGNLAR